MIVILGPLRFSIYSFGKTIAWFWTMLKGFCSNVNIFAICYELKNVWSNLLATQIN